MPKDKSEPVAAPSEITRESKNRFLNRELSWLAFNSRVTSEAANESYPVLERLRFLAISGSNLDEFYMVRVAGLKGQVAAGLEVRSADGMTPSQQLTEIMSEAAKVISDQQACWSGLIQPLRDADVHFVQQGELTEKDKKWLEGLFMGQVFPLLTPLALDPAHPFPFIRNLGLSMAFQLYRHTDGRTLQGLIMMPQVLERFVQLPGKGNRLFLQDDLISMFLDRVFPDLEIGERAWFRIVRDTEIEFDEEAEDLVSTYQSALKRRRRGSVIRLAVSGDISTDLRNMIVKGLNADPLDVVVQDGMLGLTDLSQAVDIDRPDLKFVHFDARFPERVRELDGDCFGAIRKKDFVVHHPYESFDVVVQFIRQAARDPNVVAVKQTLYRTSNDSPTVAALVEAAEAGKSVTAMVELKARFDEEANIKWARDLERAGAQVVYGFVDKKTHAKISYVVRREGSELRSYAHFGTGNYHQHTAKVYTDLSFFTCDPVLCQDAAQVFNFMTGYTEPRNLKKISVSPLNLREKLVSLIDDEIEHAKAGGPATIWAKMNSLVDPDIIDALYDASCRGVKIELVVRGVCCLRPGIPGLSENIRVKSLIGRFLEHSRIVVFGNGEELPSAAAKAYISSADWMPRNISGRVEVMVPIENPTVHEQVVQQVMEANMLDVAQSWIMQPDGSYERMARDENSFNAHVYFMTNPSLSGRGSAMSENRSDVPRLVASRP
ncbi:MAG: RNA degradosome polyphosphate kinase [Proteobacteria bacterium]|nr:RNA degradosome polyphosphate kinase [Pseudomonadota bacterium]